MAKKYVNYRVGGTPEKKDENYTVWSNDLLTKLIASKTVIEPNKSTIGHRLLESEVVYIILSGRGLMEVIEYTNHTTTNLKGVTRGLAGRTAATGAQNDKVYFDS